MEKYESSAGTRPKLSEAHKLDSPVKLLFMVSLTTTLLAFDLCGYWVQIA